MSVDALYPTMTLKGNRVRVKANFGTTQFAFDNRSHNVSNEQLLPSLDPQFEAGIASDQYLFATSRERKQMLGEVLYWKIHSRYPALAGKYTGMILEMPDREILDL